MDVKTAVEKIKELVRKGNVSKIVVRRKGEVLLSIPVSVGVVGAVIGITAAKWALLAPVFVPMSWSSASAPPQHRPLTVSVTV